MNEIIRKITEDYATAHISEAEELLMELGKIPAPSHMEDQRAAFCRSWFLAQGAEDVTIDSAKNVICKLNCTEDNELVVFMAHMDIVFPDLEPLKMTLKGRTLHAPGIGDDTANLVNLMMAAKYLLKEKPQLKTGIMIIANSCEEGLGNLDGSKEIIRTYGHRIKSFYSFDGYMGQCTFTAVGSYRYKITVKTAGGHSWLNFGSPNAIEILSRLIEKLYQMEVPTSARTTYNVGYIEGGTTVNTVAQEASMLFEFRSTSQDCLERMQKQLEEIIAGHTGEHEIITELLGVRPGNGDINQEALKSHTDLSADVIRTFYPGRIDFAAYSTDANIPLSQGIPANTIGTIIGAKAHTREEWVDLDSLPAGLKIALSLMLHYVSL
ncbi:MAG: M20/M25/M40 family metallo-hydrolase [Eubacteriales bacterium]|nr:M20/M25/M40 family metallo-hydrolase [Eubacteriales bacterium]